jgi:hydrogenase-4 component E
VTGFGDFAYDLAHLLGGAMLLVSFAMLGQRRLEAVIGALALQGALLGLAAFWQGYVQGAGQLYLTGAIALAAKAVAIPLVLRRMAGALPPAQRADSFASLEPVMLGAVALVALAFLAAVPATKGASVLARVDIAVALAILLLGALMMATRRSALAQVAGLMTIENGLILAAVGVAGMPLVVELSTAGLVLVVAVIAGVFARQLGERFGAQDTTLLDRHRGERR